jgi:hypothetical protein
MLGDHVLLYARAFWENAGNGSAAVLWRLQGNVVQRKPVETRVRLLVAQQRGCSGF